MARALPVLDTVPADFHEGWVVPRRPVVLRGAASHWPAVGKWTPAYLREKVGARRVRLEEDGIDLALGVYLDRVEADDGAPLPYLRNVFLHHELPELSPDVGALGFAEPNWFAKEPFASLIRTAVPQWLRWCELFVSRAGTRFPYVHVDRNMTHAWCAQLHGSKRYWAWPPRPGFEPTDCLGKDLETLLDSEPLTATLEAGDAIFLPAGWPHTAESLTLSISASGNFVNESNWDDFAREFFAGDLLTVLRR
jgi:hypothetical protein